MLSKTKSRTVGKRLLFLSVLFSLVCFCGIAIAQDTDLPSLKIVYLDEDDGLMSNPSELVLIPGDSLKFVAVNGNFDIIIYDAVNFLKIKVADLTIQVNSTTKPNSDIYIVKSLDEYETEYDIYCISSNIWPAAPPRIIIVAQ